jgi:hypothetical protein
MAMPRSAFILKPRNLSIEAKSAKIVYHEKHKPHEHETTNPNNRIG